MAELTRGQKAARTRARNKQAEARDALVDKAGMSLPLGEWRSIIDDLESAEQNLTSFARLVSADLLLQVDGHIQLTDDGETEQPGATLRCTWDGTQWKVGFES